MHVHTQWRARGGLPTVRSREVKVKNPYLLFSLIWAKKWINAFFTSTNKKPIMCSDYVLVSVAVWTWIFYTQCSAKCSMRRWMPWVDWQSIVRTLYIQLRQELKHGGASSDSGEVDIFDDYMEQLKHAPSVKVTIHLDKRITPMPKFRDCVLLYLKIINLRICIILLWAEHEVTQLCVMRRQFFDRKEERQLEDVGLRED